MTDATARDWAGLEEILGYTFRNQELLIQACTHVSRLQASREYHLSNQRLEFLGDAVLRLVLASTAYHTFPAEDEGKLSRQVEILGHNEHLASLAMKFNLSDFILTQNEAKSQALVHQSGVLADTMEAIIGAIYLDAGWEGARDWVSGMIGRMEGQEAEAADDDFNLKGKLQEALVKLNPPQAPEYRLVHREGPDHAPSFKVELWVGEDKVSEAVGSSRQKAETEAARLGLAQFQKAGSIDKTDESR